MPSVTPSAMLLIDIENMVGTSAKTSGFEVKIDALIRQAGPGIPVIAACAALSHAQYRCR